MTPPAAAGTRSIRREVAAIRASEISAFDVIGPIMIGPSSSHTAGALRIALLASRLLTRPLASVRFTLYGSFAQTGSGHGTDRALAAGMLGLRADDPRIRDSRELAQGQGVQMDFVSEEGTADMHPNTVDIVMTDTAGEQTRVRGVSLGGARAMITRIDDVELELTGLYNTLVIYNIDRPGVVARIAALLSEHAINIAYMKMYRRDRGARAWTVIETDERIPLDLVQRLRCLEWVQQAVLIPALESSEEAQAEPVLSLDRAALVADAVPGERELRREDLQFEDAQGLIACCRATELTIPQLMLAREVLLFGGTIEGHRERMAHSWGVMQAAMTTGIHAPQVSMGRLIGGEASLVWSRVEADAGQSLGGSLMQRAAAYAMAVIEVNASMGLIVAAPTAGAAGVVPAALQATGERLEVARDAQVEALFSAAALGLVLMARGTVSGAEGGCQAETGSAAAMAAGALVLRSGGTPEAALAAASTSLQNVLGTVCDPIGGLVEAPCQRRNALAAVNAILSADLAMAGLTAVVDFDDMVEAARVVGASMPASLRETGEGGTAAAYRAACARCPQGQTQP